MNDSTRNAARRMADALLLEGIEPTTLIVRERLGRGSNSTISSTLKAWRQERGIAEGSGALTGLTIHPALGTLPPPLAEAMSQLWVLAVNEAQQALAGERRALSQEKEAMLQALRDNEQQLQLGKERLRDVSDRLFDAETSIGTLQEKAQAAALNHTRESSLLHSQLAGIDSELAQARQQQQALRQQLEEQQNAHSQALETVRERSKQDEALAYARLEGLRLQLLNDVAAERERIKQELTELRQQAKAKEAELISRHEQQAKTWQDEFKRAQDSAGQLQQTLGLRDTELGRLQERQVQSQAHCDRLQQENNRLLLLLEQIMAARSSNESASGTVTIEVPPTAPDNRPATAGHDPASATPP